MDPWLDQDQSQNLTTSSLTKVRPIFSHNLVHLTFSDQISALNPAVLTFVNFGVFAPILISKQLIQSLPLLSAVLWCSTEVSWWVCSGHKDHATSPATRGMDGWRVPTAPSHFTHARATLSTYEAALWPSAVGWARATATPGVQEEGAVVLVYAAVWTCRSA